MRTSMRRVVSRTLNVPPVRGITKAVLLLVLGLVVGGGSHRNVQAVSVIGGYQGPRLAGLVVQGLKVPRKRLFTTGTWGGKGGQAPFEERPLINWNLTAVVVCVGAYVDEIWSVWAGPGAPGGSRSRQCASGSKQVFDLEYGEVLAKVRLRAGAWIDGIELETNRGRRRWFGNSAGGVGLSTCEFNRDYSKARAIVGFRGRRGRYVDAIGFVVRVEGEQIPQPVFNCGAFVN